MAKKEERLRWGEEKGTYRKIPKISPGLIFFKGPFGGAYLRRKICVQVQAPGGLIFGEAI